MDFNYSNGDESIKFEDKCPVIQADKSSDEILSLIEKGDIKGVEKMLDNGVPIHYRNYETLLQKAVECGKTKIATYLLNLYIK